MRNDRTSSNSSGPLTGPSCGMIQFGIHIECRGKRFFARVSVYIFSFQVENARFTGHFGGLTYSTGPSRRKNEYRTSVVPR